MKKAQTLSINTIIVSVIALIILVVLVAIFTGRFAEIDPCKSNPNGEDCICEGYEYKDPVLRAMLESEISHYCVHLPDIFTASDVASGMCLAQHLSQPSLRDGVWLIEPDVGRA